MNVVESSVELSKKLNGLVAQITDATAAENANAQARAEAYESGDATRIAQAEAKYRDAQSKLSGLCAARDHVAKKIESAKVLETNQLLAELRKKLAGEKDAVMELVEDVEDATVALVERVTALLSAADALNTTSRKLGVDHLFSRDNVALYVSGEISKLFPSSSTFRTSNITSLFNTTAVNLDRVK